MIDQDNIWLMTLGHELESHPAHTILDDPAVIVLPFRARASIDQHLYDEATILGYQVRQDTGEIWFVLRVPDQRRRVAVMLQWPTLSKTRLQEFAL